MIICHKQDCETPATVFPEYGGHFCDFHAFAEGAAEWDSRRLKLEARRLTWLMQCILRAAEHNGRWLLVGSQMRSARILERRGFVEVLRAADGGHVATLTPAGAEVLRRTDLARCGACRRLVPG